MEYAIYALVFIAGGIIFAPLWFLMGRNNPGDVNKIVDRLKAIYAKRAQLAEEAKADLLKLGIKV